MNRVEKVKGKALTFALDYANLVLEHKRNRFLGNLIGSLTNKNRLRPSPKAVFCVPLKALPFWVCPQDSAGESCSGVPFWQRKVWEMVQSVGLRSPRTEVCSSWPLSAAR